jgi:adenosylmethionine-8-amino-7-oxononanoate aminotransferase
MSAGAVFFTTGGSDAVDTAAKIARRYWRIAGRPERTTIIARSGGYHGMNAFGTSLAGIDANAEGWGPLVREVVHLPAHSTDALADYLAKYGDSVAAFIGEPVQGAGGVNPPQPDYWPSVAEICRRHNVLLIADEVVTAFGRVGTWFASERYGIEPDLIVTAKGITSGYLPLGAVIAGDRVASVCFADDAGPMRHGYTYSGHPTACAVALANLRLIDEEGLVGLAQERESSFAETMSALSEHRAVREVRQAGLLAGVELALDELPAGDGSLVVDAARENGVLTRLLCGHTLQISPPLIADEVDFATLATSLIDALGLACGADDPVEVT